MEIFLNLWNNWTNLEKISFFSIFLVIFLLIPTAIYVVTKNKSLVLFSVLSLLSSALLTLTGILILSVILNIEITYIFLLTPFTILFINLLNIGTCIGYYTLHSKKKDFNLIDLKKEFLKDTTQLSILILLLFSSLSISLTSLFLTFILFTGILSLGVIWFNYVLLHRLVKK